MVDNTYKTKLIDYLKRNLKKGYPVDTLKIALINQGYVRSTIDEAIKEAMKQMAAEAPVIKEKPEIEHEVVKTEPLIEEKKSFWKKLFGWFKK
jgi:TPP-dependent pyruvate/acetoin dehydrogenase alpha subunit